MTFFMSQIDNQVGMARNPEDYGDYSILEVSISKLAGIGRELW